MPKQVQFSFTAGAPVAINIKDSEGKARHILATLTIPHVQEQDDKDATTGKPKFDIQFSITLQDITEQVSAGIIGATGIANIPAVSVGKDSSGSGDSSSKDSK